MGVYCDGREIENEGMKNGFHHFNRGEKVHPNPLKELDDSKSPDPKPPVLIDFQFRKRLFSNG
jgi:hypothetical protein